MNRPFACACLVLIGLTLTGVLSPAARADGPAPRTATGERAVLSWADGELARGRGDHAARGLLRAFKRSPSAALLTRYGQIALPCQPPSDERALARAQRAAKRLLSAIESGSKRQPPLEVNGQLGRYAGWALSLGGQLPRGLEVAASYGARDDAQTVTCLRSMAALAIAAGALSEARAALTLARGFAPTDLDLASELGLLLLAAGEAWQALVPLAERFALDPASLAARRDFAYALLAAGRAGEGYELLAVAQEACSELDECLLELARAALEAHRALDAEHHAHTLLSRRPDALDALFLLAEAQGQRGDAAGAEASYRRVLELAPGNLRARAALAAPGSGAAP